MGGQQPGHVRTDLHRGAHPGINASIGLDLRAGPRRKGRCVQVPAPRLVPRPGGDGSQDLRGERAQALLDRAVELAALMNEAWSVAILEQGDHPVQLIQLLTEELGHDRVVQALDGRLVEAPLEDHRIHGPGAILKHGRLLEAIPLEPSPCLIAIDRRQHQQKIEALRDLRQDPVCLPHGLHHGPAPEGVEVGRAMRRQLARIGKEDMAEGPRQPLPHRLEDQRKDLTGGGVAVDRVDLQAKEVAPELSEVCAGEDRDHGRRRTACRRRHLDPCLSPPHLHPPQGLLELMDEGPGLGAAGDDQPEARPKLVHGPGLVSRALTLLPDLHDEARPELGRQGPDDATNQASDSRLRSLAASGDQIGGLAGHQAHGRVVAAP